MLSIEEKCKQDRDQLLLSGDTNPRSWEQAGETVINQDDLVDIYNINKHDLKLVLLFHDG
eukprot:15328398-Ditylum_brightwellii.AAC.1